MAERKFLKFPELSTKNKRLLRVAAVALLGVGVWIAFKNSSYHETYYNDPNPDNNHGTTLFSRTESGHEAFYLRMPVGANSGDAANELAEDMFAPVPIADRSRLADKIAHSGPFSTEMNDSGNYDILDNPGHLDSYVTISPAILAEVMSHRPTATEVPTATPVPLVVEKPNQIDDKRGIYAAAAVGALGLLATFTGIALQIRKRIRQSPQSAALPPVDVITNPQIATNTRQLIQFTTQLPERVIRGRKTVVYSLFKGDLERKIAARTFGPSAQADSPAAQQDLIIAAKNLMDENGLPANRQLEILKELTLNMVNGQGKLEMAVSIDTSSPNRQEDGLLVINDALAWPGHRTPVLIHIPFKSITPTELIDTVQIATS